MSAMKVNILLTTFILFTHFISIAQEVRIESITNITDSAFTYPSFNKSNNSIIAQKKVGNHLQLFSISVEGKQIQLTFDSADHKHAAISPDGKTFAYTKEWNGQADIHLYSFDNASDRNLTNTPAYYEAHPSWVSDSAIVFNTNRYDTLQEISSLNLITGKITRLTTNTEEDTYGSISPNGQQLVYTKWLDGQRNAEIYLLSLSDGIEKRITHDPARDVAPVWISDSLISYGRGGNLFLYNVFSKTHTKLITGNSEYILARGVPAGDHKILCEKIKNRVSAGLVIISF